MSLLSEADSGEADNGSSRAKLLQEVVIMRQFRHPNIPRLYGVVDEDRVSVQGPIKWGRARGGLGVGRGEEIVSHFWFEIQCAYIHVSSKPNFLEYRVHLPYGISFDSVLVSCLVFLSVQHTVLVSEHFPRGDLRKILVQLQMGRR